MLSIRMMRMGRKNRPFFRLVVSEVTFKRDGRHVETLGFYDPIAKTEEKQYSLQKDRAEYWLSVGAQPSETVLSIFRRFKVSLPDFIFKSKSQRQKAKRRARAEKAEGAAPGAAKEAKATKETKAVKETKAPKEAKAAKETKAKKGGKKEK